VGLINQSPPVPRPGRFLKQKVIMDITRQKLLALRNAINAILEDGKTGQLPSTGGRRSMTKRDLVQMHAQNFANGTWRKPDELLKGKRK
jgi:hypothetical protein